MTIPTGNFTTFFDKDNPHHRAFFQRALEKLLSHEPGALDDGSELVSIWRAGSITSPNKDQEAIELALPLIKQFEGCKLKAYPDPETKAEPWTIGWGTTIYPDGGKVKKDDQINQGRADELLEARVANDLSVISKKIERWAELNSNQKAALLSFTYNCGTGWYNSNQFTTITSVIKDGRWLAAPDAMALYVNPGGPSEAGLRRRRAAEAALWGQGLPARPTASASAQQQVSQETIEWRSRINALDLSQPDASTCQATCIAMALKEKNILKIRNELTQIGIAGDPAVMGKVIKKYTSNYSYSSDASMMDICQWLQQGEFLIIHGWFTASGHVICLDGIRREKLGQKYNINTKDPWSEFNAPAWRYDNPSVKFFDGFYSEQLIYSACIAGASSTDAYRIYKRGELDRAKRAGWVHRFWA